MISYKLKCATQVKQNKATKVSSPKNNFALFNALLYFLALLILSLYRLPSCISKSADMLSRFLTKVLVTALAALLASYLLKGVRINGIETALVLALVLALLNNFIKPILVILTLPITIITLGLFLLV